MRIRERLYAIALERGLRETTVRSYEILLDRMNLLDLIDPDIQTVQDAIWTIDNPNTRRAAIIAVRSVTGMKIKIPRGVPRRYDLPDEDTLRLALMTSPHEPRGLLMMYAGLRVGEACAITSVDVSGDRLLVARQVVEVHHTGKPTTRRIGPVKTHESIVVIPHWLTDIVLSLDTWVSPASVRESLRRAGQKVGIALNPHLLRHWYATESIKRGVPLPLVSKQLRHSDIAVTLRSYVEHSTSDIHDAFG